MPPPSAGSATSRAGASRAAASPAPESCPAQVFSRMTEAQRVGQLFLVGIAGATTAEVAQAVSAYHFGSLLWEGTSTAGVAADQQATEAIQSLASSAATAR